MRNALIKMARKSHLNWNLYKDMPTAATRAVAIAKLRISVFEKRR
jgi:hypothetical protein